MKKVLYFLVVVILIEVVAILLINYMYTNHINSGTKQLAAIENMID